MVAWVEVCKNSGRVVFKGTTSDREEQMQELEEDVWITEVFAPGMQIPGSLQLQPSVRHTKRNKIHPGTTEMVTHSPAPTEPPNSNIFRASYY